MMAAGCGAFLGYLSFRGKAWRRAYALAATPILYLLLGFFAWFFGWLKDLAAAIFSQLWEWLVAALPESWEERIDAIPWAETSGYFLDVAWVLPVGPVFGLITLTFTTCFVVRLVRWLTTIKIMGTSIGDG